MELKPNEMLQFFLQTTVEKSYYTIKIILTKTEKPIAGVDLKDVLGKSI